MKNLLYSLLICIPVCAMEPSSDSDSEKGIHSRLSLMPQTVKEPSQAECEVEEMYNFLTENGIGTNQTTPAALASGQLFRSNSDSSISTVSSRRSSSSTNEKGIIGDEMGNKKEKLSKKARSFHGSSKIEFLEEGELFVGKVSPPIFARARALFSPFSSKKRGEDKKALLLSSNVSEPQKTLSRLVPKKINSSPDKLLLSEIEKQDRDGSQKPQKLTAKTKKVSASEPILPGLSSVSKGEDKLRQEKRKTEYKEIIALCKRYNAENAINFLSDFGEESAPLSASQLKTITKMLISSVEIVLAEEKKIKFLSVVLNKLIKTQENYPEIGKLLSENDNDDVLFYPVVKDLRDVIGCKTIADHAKEILANTQLT